VALTADVFGETHLDPEQKPFDAWVLKPIDISTLGAELRRLCYGDASEGSGRTGAPSSANTPGRTATTRLPPELQRRYLDEIEALCTRARSALVRGDMPALREHTHDLLGIAGVMGLVEAAAIAADLDAAVKTGDKGRAAQLVQALERCARAAAQA
jgi:HPt (histidine-containing phosphotransfer) domain-containing protein